MAKWKSLAGIIQKDQSTGKIRLNLGIHGIERLMDSIKTQIDTDGSSIVISWQTDIDPDGDGEQTYSARHGSKFLAFVTGAYFNPDTARHSFYSPTVSADIDVSGNITTLYIDDLFEGKLTIV